MLQSVEDLEICWSDQYEIFPLKNNQRTASEDSWPYTAIAGLYQIHHNRLEIVMLITSQPGPLSSVTHLQLFTSHI